MQNLTTVLGSSAAATRFLQLAQASYRQPTLQLTVWDYTGTTMIADATNDLIRCELDFTDEVAAQQSRYTIANKNAQYSLFGGSAGNVFALNNRLVLKKGFIDPTNGTVYLIPASVTLVTSVTADYNRQEDVPVLNVSGLDLLKNPVRQRITTDLYTNMTPDQIATDVAVRYAGFTAGQLELGGTAANLPRYPAAQFPDYSVLDIFKTLYDPYLFYVRVGEDGSLQSGPRLGSSYSALSGILGYPDQLTAPSSGAVAFQFPDSPIVDSSQEGWRDYESVNQVRVLGIQASEVVTLGPIQELASLSQSSVAPDTQAVYNFQFSEGNGGQNAVVAKNVYVVATYSTDGTTFYSVTMGGENNPSEFTVINSDGHTCGTFNVLSIGPTVCVFRAWGFQYSAGGGLFGGSVRHEGGFDYSAVVYGQPQVSATPSITAICDYNPVLVTGESASNTFGDNQTFQLAHSPLAMGTPIEVQINPSSLPTSISIAATASGAQTVQVYYSGSRLYAGSVLKMEPTSGVFEYLTLVGPSGSLGMTDSLGQIYDSNGTTWNLESPTQNAYGSGATPVAVLSGVSSDDDANLSQVFKTDFERGRVVLQTLVYREFTADTATGGMTFTGGGGEASVSNNFNLLGLAVQTPLALYQTFRQQDTTFTFTGLVSGQSYSLRFHAVDPYSDGPGQRRFSIIWDEVEMVAGIDVWQVAGGGLPNTNGSNAANNNNAYQQQVDGFVADTTGKIVVAFTQHDSALGNPSNGYFLNSCTNNADGTGNNATFGCICGVEIIQTQGQGPEAYAVNIGGPTLNATPPTVKVNYGYSPIQAQYGVQSMEVDNPLLRTKAMCEAVAQFYLNYAAWSKYPITLMSHSVPHLQAGDLVRYYNPKANADLWCYVQGIKRTMDRTQAKGDMDAYSLYLIYAQGRG